LSPQALLLVLVSALLHALWSTSIKTSREPLAFNVLQAALTLPPALAVISLLDLGALRGVWIALAVTSLSHGAYFYLLSRALSAGDLTLVYPISRSTPALLPLVAVPLLGESLSAGGALGIATVVAGMWLVSTRGAVRWRAFVGAGTGWAYLTLLSTVAYSLCDKYAMARLDPAALGPVPPALAVYCLLSTGGLVCFLPIALPGLRAASLAHALRAEWRGALAAAAVSFGSYSLILEAYRSAPASYVVAVRQTSVIFALLIGVRLLREGPGRARTLGALSSVAGVALIALFP
jgi:drug/metabolite transporter (DMT)-like permease